ncbi:MAG: glycosyltransferase [bacterium]|nr:glycosyltransferase [bacterium]
MSDRLAILVGHGASREAEGARLLRSLLAQSRTDWHLYVGFLEPPEVPVPDWCVHPRVTVRREWPRQGVSAGYNALAAMGDEEWIVWLNDDCEVEPAWDAEAIAALRATPRAGMAVLPYLTPHPPYGWHVNEFPAGLLYANFGLFRRVDFEAVGGFDPRVRMYGCDNALSMRFQAAGRPLVVAPRARVVHHYREDEARAQTVADYDRIYATWRSVWAEREPRVSELRASQAAMPAYDLVQQPVEQYAARYGVTARGHSTEAQVICG